MVMKGNDEVIQNEMVIEKNDKDKMVIKGTVWVEMMMKK